MTLWEQLDRVWAGNGAANQRLREIVHGLIAEEREAVRIVVADLLMLSVRATAALRRGNADRAVELLSHAARIAAKAGIDRTMLRDEEQP